MDLRGFFWSSLRWLRLLLMNLYFWGGIGALLAIGIGVFLMVDAIIMPSYTRYDASIQVPDVERQEFARAKTRLLEKGLRVKRQTGRYNPNVDTGTVVDQTPLPNSNVKPNRRIYLTVNSGEVPMVKMPDLKGMSVREAKNRISSLGLSVGDVKKDPIPSPYANTITKQNPASGDSLEKGESVKLWYSTGPGGKKVTVPSVVGYTIEEARERLLKQQLRAVVVDTTSTSQELGTESSSTSQPQGTASSERNRPPERDMFVRSQGRPPNTSVRAGTEVRLFPTTDSSEVAAQRETGPDTLNADTLDADPTDTLETGSN